MLKIYPVETKEDIKNVKELFIEYSNSLDFDLGFQNFKEELANLPGKYSPPQGRLLLAKYQNEIAGCGALRKLNDNVCEAKRLYVKPQFRSLKIGKKLLESIIAEARKMGYSAIRGDTVSSMQIAQALYASFGFKEIEPYCYNPIEGVKFIELKL